MIRSKGLERSSNYRLQLCRFAVLDGCQRPSLLQEELTYTGEDLREKREETCGFPNDSNICALAGLSSSA